MISTRTKAMKHWKEQRKTGVHGGKESKTCCTADSLREMHFILLLGILMTLVLFCCSGRTSRRVVWSIIVIVILFICTVVLAIVDSSSCELIVLRGSIVWSLGNQKYVVQNFVFFCPPSSAHFIHNFNFNTYFFISIIGTGAFFHVSPKMQKFCSFILEAEFYSFVRFFVKNKIRRVPSDPLSCLCF